MDAFPTPAPRPTHISRRTSQPANQDYAVPAAPAPSPSGSTSSMIASISPPSFLASTHPAYRGAAQTQTATRTSLLRSPALAPPPPRPAPTPTSRGSHLPHPILTYPLDLPKSRHRSLSTIQSVSPRSRMRSSGGSREVLLEVAGHEASRERERAAAAGAVPGRPAQAQGQTQTAPRVPRRTHSVFDFGPRVPAWASTGPVETPTIHVEVAARPRAPSQDVAREHDAHAHDGPERVKPKASLAGLFSAFNHSGSAGSAKRSGPPGRNSTQEPDLGQTSSKQETCTSTQEVEVAPVRLTTESDRKGPTHKRKTSRLSIFGFGFLSKSKTPSKDAKAAAARFDERNVPRATAVSKPQSPQRRLLADTSEPSFGNPLTQSSKRNLRTLYRRPSQELLAKRSSPSGLPSRPSFGSSTRGSPPSKPVTLTHYPVASLLPAETRRSESFVRDRAQTTGDANRESPRKLSRKPSFLRRAASSQIFTRGSVYANASTMTLRPAESNLTIATGASERVIDIIARVETSGPSRTDAHGDTPSSARALTPSEQIVERTRQSWFDAQKTAGSMPASASQQSRLGFGRKGSEPALSTSAVRKREATARMSKLAGMRRLRASKSAEPLRAVSRQSSSATRSTNSRDRKVSTSSVESARERSLLRAAGKENRAELLERPRQPPMSRPRVPPLQPLALAAYQGNAAGFLSTPSLARSSTGVQSPSQSTVPSLMTPPATADSTSFSVTMQTSSHSHMHRCSSSSSFGVPLPLPPPKEPLPALPAKSAADGEPRTIRASLRYSKSAGRILGAEVEIGPQAWQTLPPALYRPDPPRARVQHMRRESSTTPSVPGQDGRARRGQGSSKRTSTYEPQHDGPGTIRRPSVQSLQPKSHGDRLSASAEDTSPDSPTALIEQYLRPSPDYDRTPPHAFLGHEQTASYPSPYRKSRQAGRKSLSDDLVVQAARTTHPVGKENRSNPLEDDRLAAMSRLALHKEVYKAEEEKHNAEVERLRVLQDYVALQERMRAMSAGRRSSELHRSSEESLGMRPRIVAPSDSPEGYQFEEERASIEFSLGSGKHDGRRA